MLTSALYKEVGVDVGHTTVLRASTEALVVFGSGHGNRFGLVGCRLCRAGRCRRRTLNEYL